MPPGMVPVATVATTVLVPVSMTETLFENTVVAYTRVPLGFAATASGLPPNVTVAVTALAAVSMTETLFDVRFAT